MKLRTLFVMYFVATGFGLSANADSVVVNGSFENPVAPGGGSLGGTIPTGWSALGNGSTVDIISAGFGGGAIAADGNQFVDLIGGGAGTFPSGLSQTVSLDAGTTYNFSFAYNGDGGLLFKPQVLDYSLGSLLSGSVDATSLNVYPVFGTTTPWQNFSQQFSVATTGDYVLTFETPAGAFESPFVDSVQITAATPLPSSVWGGLVLLGALGLTAAVQRRIAVR